jgi:CHAT domain-containing protein/tetratricopeptide (TPR) repeat protein
MWLTAFVLLLAAAQPGGARPALLLEEGDAERTTLEQRLKEAVARRDTAEALATARSLRQAHERENGRDRQRLAAALDSLARDLRPLEAPEVQSLAESLLLQSLQVQQEGLARAGIGQAATMEQLSELYYFGGRWEEAERIDRQVLSLRLESLGPDAPEVAASQQNVGLNLQWQGRYREAEPFFRESVRALEKARPPSPVELAYALDYLAENLRAQNRYAEAEPLFERALRVCGEEATPADRLVLMANFSGLYRDTQRFGQAQWWARQAAEIAEATPELTAAERVPALLNLAELFRMQGEPDLAEPLYRRALEAARRGFRADHPRLGTVISQLAVNLTEQGHDVEAEALFREALTIKAKGWGPRGLDVAHTDQQLGELLRGRGDSRGAEDAFREALAIREERLGPRHPDVAVSLVAIAELTRGVPGRGPEAEGDLARALDILDRTPAEPRARARAYALRAQIENLSGRKDRARSDLARALEIVERLRPEAGGSESTRARLVEQYDDDFHRMVDWLVEAGDSDRAFSYAESARGRTLLDQLAGSGVDIRSGIDPDERRRLEARESEIGGRLSECRSRLDALRAGSEASQAARAREIVDLEDQLAAATLDFERTYEEIRNASKLWRGRAGLGEIVDLETVQRELVPKGGLILYYDIGPEHSHLWVIPPGGRRSQVFTLRVPPGATALPIEPGPLTASSLRRVVDPIAGGGGVLGRLSEPPGRSRTRIEATLHSLWGVLVPEGTWKLVRGASEVVVIPDGQLHRLPFEALVVGRAGTGTARYWLDDGPVVRYSTSAAVMRALAARSALAPSPPAGTVLSVSDPVFDPKGAEPGPGAPGDPSVSGGPLPSLPTGWSRERLPGTAREADLVRAAFAPLGRRVVALQRLAAREPAVRASLPAARFIHLATHGLVDERPGSLFAALALTPPPRPAGPEDDGQLQLFEIYQVRLNAELAVLSSCESRSGALVAGEGVFALSRAFLVAGARRVVASLWPAEDDATAALMGSFFAAVAEEERKGRPPDYGRALARAKREVRAKAGWSDPFFWAPFVLDGAH